MKDLYDIGEIPPLGQVPRYMHAQVVRQDRYGEPRQAYRVERVEVPDIGPGEVLVYVMATGINYSGIWAALGSPLDVIQVRQRAGEPWDFHVGGSDCSGVVYAVGEGVTSVKVGDHVVTHPGWWDPDDPFVQAGGDGTLSSTMKIWGYETTWGSFAQFAKAQAHQCLLKPEGLTWEAAASYMLVGSTAYRMLNGWPPHIVQSGDVVLVWGGAGGLGVMAIQLVKEMGGLPVAVVSNEERGEHCKRLGAVGYINRGDYDHWGVMPSWSDDEAYGRWLKGARAVGRAVWDARRRAQESPHRVRAPWRGHHAHLPLRLRYGRHGGHMRRYLRLQHHRRPALPLDTPEAPPGLPCSQRCRGRRPQPTGRGRQDRPLPLAGLRVSGYPLANQLMRDNRHSPGNMAALVGAPREGLIDLSGA